MARTPWHKQQPERVEWELERLRDDAGLTIEDSQVREIEGFLTVEAALTFRGEPLPVKIGFPLDYPEAPPLIVSEQVVLDRHQDRKGRNFCLLDDPDTDWRPRRSAAELVVLLKALLDDTEQGIETVALGEGDIPEPASAYYAHTAGISVLATEPFWAEELERREGRATLAESQAGNVLFLLNADGFETPSREFAAEFANVSKTKPSSWVAVDEAPDPADLEAALAELLETRPAGMLARLRNRAGYSRQKVGTEWLGVTFLEEGPTRGELRRTWVFVEVTVRGKGGSLTVGRIAQAQALTLAERQRRLPDLEGLESRRLLVIGAGSVGGLVAFELAKAGVGEIEIVDYDTYDVNNAVRHIGETQLSGVNKATMVASKCHGMNPFATATDHRFRVGSTLEASEQLDELVRTSDVVIETTGSQVVTRIMQQRCREAGKTLIIAALTAGSYGGEVLVARPLGACFDCFVLSQEDGAVPQPQAGPRHRVTPIGCRHPAFSGAGFDATELGALAARTAVRLTGAVGYPPLDYDWAIVNFRGEPMYEKGALRVHRDCSRAH